MNATRYVDCIIFCQKGIFDGSQNSQRLIGGTGTTLRGRKVITRKAAINTEFDKRNSPAQNLLESICTVRGYELGRVKSIRQGRVNLKDSYCVAKDGEIYAHSMHISPYEQGNIFNKDPDRPKRLLMHKREIRKLHDLQKQDGYALIPLSLYFKDSRVKVELGLCKGKKTYDKRDAIAKRDAKREIERAMKARR